MSGLSSTTFSRMGRIFAGIGKLLGAGEISLSFGTGPHGVQLFPHGYTGLYGWQWECDVLPSALGPVQSISLLLREFPLEAVRRPAACNKLIFLNKALNGYFFSYKYRLPDVFLFAHPVGSIIGNAGYSDFLVISQNVTINTGTEQGPDDLPKLGKGLFLGAGAKIIGRKPIGDRVSVGVDAIVYDQAVPDDKVVERAPSGEIVVRDRRVEFCTAQKFFNEETT